MTELFQPFQQLNPTLELSIVVYVILKCTQRGWLAGWVNAISWQWMHNQPVRFRSIKARPNDAINEIGPKTWLSADGWSNNNNKFSEHRIAPATDTHISKLLSSLSCRYTLHLSYYNTACSKLNFKLLKLSSRLHTTTSRTSGYPQTEKKLAHNTDCLRFTCIQQRLGRCKWSSAGTSKKVKEKKDNAPFLRTESDSEID